MGGEHSEVVDESFRKEDWELVDNNSKLILWANRKDNNLRVEQYDIFSDNEEQFKHEQNMYVLRKNNPFLVAALYLQSQSQGDFCSTSYRQKLFIEAIPIRLSDIEHIPYPDYLHLYSQSLRGFQQLAKQIGCFAVEEEYIGINNRGTVKVWMNEQYDKSFIVGSKITEEIMVRGIIDLIDKNLDQAQLPSNVPSVRNYVYRNADTLRFDQAIGEFEQFVREFNRGETPQKLDCIDRVGGILAIANRDRDSSGFITEELHTEVPQPYGTITHVNTYPLVISTQGEYSRPQLVDGQLLNGQYALSTPRIPEPPAGFDVPIVQGRFVPLKGSEIIRERQIVDPSTVRQNVQIVRSMKSQGNGYQVYNAIPENIQVNRSPVTSQFVQNLPVNQQLGQIRVENRVLLRESGVVQVPQQIVYQQQPVYQQRPPVFQQQIIQNQQPAQVIPRPLPVPIQNQGSRVQTNQYPPVNEAISIRGAPVGSAISQQQNFSQAVMVRGAPYGSNIVQQQNGGDSFVKVASNSGVLSINAKSSQIKTSNSYLNDQWNGQYSETVNQNNSGIDNIASNMMNAVQNEQRPIIQQTEQIYNGYSSNGASNDYANNLYNMLANEKQPTIVQPTQFNNVQEVYSADSIAANTIGNIEREKPVVFDGGFNGNFNFFANNTQQTNEQAGANQNIRFNQYGSQPNYSETVTSSLQTYQNPIQTPTYSGNNSEQQIGLSFNPSYGNNFTKKQSGTFGSNSNVLVADMNIDDGKSSEEFLRKLKEISSPSNIQVPTYEAYSSSSFRNAFDNGNDYNATPAAKIEQNKQYYAPQYGKYEETYSYGQREYSQPVSIIDGARVTESPSQPDDEEEFGRNAVSNIIAPQPDYSNQYSPVINEPMKFEQNIEMKYSMFQSEQPEPYQYKYSSNTYQANYDPELLADMNNLKSGQ